MANTKQAKKAGRPPIIGSPQEFDARVQEYREQCEANDVPITITGMALHLGLAARQSLYDYGKREEFSYSVKRARLLVEHAYELRLHGSNAGGAIFALKNCGWTDQQQHTHVGRVEMGDDDEVRERLEKRIADIGSRLRAHGVIAVDTERSG